MRKLTRIFCYLCLVLGVFFSTVGVFAQEEAKPDCPGPTEGRVGGTDAGYKFYQPDGTPFGQPKAGIILCPNSPNLLSCDNDFEYNGMDGASMTFLRPLGYPGGPLTITCQTDTDGTYTYNIADAQTLQFGGCEEATNECGDGAAPGEGVIVVDDQGLDGSRITNHSGGGGITLRNDDRSGATAKILDDLILDFEIKYAPGDDTIAENEGGGTGEEGGGEGEPGGGGEGGEGEAEAGGTTVAHVSTKRQDETLAAITFKGDTEADLSFDYTHMTFEARVIVGEGADPINIVIEDDEFGTEPVVVPEGEADTLVPTIRNIVRGTSSLLFDIEAPDKTKIEVVVRGLGVYITDGSAKDSEQLKITFNKVDYFGENFFVDTFTQYCDGIGRFSGSTGLNGTFKIGDSLTYVPLSEHVGQNYYLDLSALDIPGLTALGDKVTIPEGTIDKIDMTFPLIEERRSTGDYLYTCTTSPISIDNQYSNFGTEVGSFTGATGANGIFRIGDNLVYHNPYPEDEDSFTIDLATLGLGTKELSETQLLIKEGSAIDKEGVTFTVTATDNAGNPVTFQSGPISVDTIRPTFSQEFLDAGKFIELFIPDSKLSDPRYKGFKEKFGVEKSIWGDEDHLRVLLPKDDGTDEGNPLVTVDFSDISTAGNLEKTNRAEDLEMTLDRYYDSIYTNISEIEGYIDQSDYIKRIIYTDNAGNEPVDGAGNPLQLSTKAVAIDMIAPQIPIGPPSYTIFEILVNKLIAIIGDPIKLKVPLQDARSEAIRFSSDLTGIGGTLAEYLFASGEQNFTIKAGEIQAGDDYNRVIYYFDKAFNLVEREIDKILIDNRVSTFDTSCGATFEVIDKNLHWGDFNQIADISNDAPDEIIFKSPNNAIEGCDLDTFSIDFTPISRKKDLVDSYSRIPADGRVIQIEVGQGTLDDAQKQLVLKAHDEYGNTKDYLTGTLNIDNELTTRQMLTDHTKFADFNTVEKTLYVGLNDRIDIVLQIAEMKDIVSVKVKIEGGLTEYTLIQDPQSLDDILNRRPNTNPWRGVTAISPGNFIVEPKYLTFVITDDAGNVVELEGNQKIYISNKLPSSGGDGGTENLHRDGFSSGIPVRGNGDFLREKDLFDSVKVKEYMSEAERYERKIDFLKKHGFELGPDELGYLKARSLNRRLNYLEPTVNKNHDKEAPSYWELMKERLRISRKKVIENQVEPHLLENKVRKRIDPNKAVKNWNNLADREGGLHTQQTLENLRRSIRKEEPTFSRPGTLRKSELSQRGRIGIIK